MNQVIVSMRDNTSKYICSSRTFYVLSEKGTNYNIGQHFDLSQFEKCFNNGITVIVQP